MGEFYDPSPHVHWCKKLDHRIISKKKLDHRRIDYDNWNSWRLKLYILNLGLRFHNRDIKIHLSQKFNNIIRTYILI